MSASRTSITETDPSAVVHLRLPLDVRRALRAISALSGRTQAEVISGLVAAEAGRLQVPGAVVAASANVR